MGFPSDDDDTTIWHDVSRLQDFWKAIRERQKVLQYDFFGGTPISPSTDAPATLPADGDVAHIAATGLAYSANYFPISSIDAWIGDALSLFLATATKSGGSWSDLTNYDGQKEIRLWGPFTDDTQAPGNPNAWGLYEYVNGLSFDRDGTAGGDPSALAWGFTRKYPREIDSLSSTQYRQAPTTAGLGFTNGDKARCLADGKVYLRSAGAWVAQGETVWPDVITDVGDFSEGDYVGPWVWNERRKALKALKWTGTGVPDFTGTTSGYPDTQYVGGTQPAVVGVTSGDVWAGDSNAYVNGGGDDTDLAGIKGGAEADWQTPPGGSFGSTNPQPGVTYANLSSTPDPPPLHYGASMGRVANWKMTSAAANFSTPISKAVDWYYGYTDAFTTGADVEHVFDAQGDGVVHDQALHLWNTVSPTTAAVSESGSVFTSNTTKPSWPGDPDGTTTSRTKGYDILAMAVVVRWQLDYV